MKTLDNWIGFFGCYIFVEWCSNDLTLPQTIGHIIHQITSMM